MKRLFSSAEMRTLRPSADHGLSSEPSLGLVWATLGRRDFARARQTPGFARWTSYREFVQERDGLYMGYGLAGVLGALQPVSFDAFERWARLTGALIDIDGLDDFAGHWRWRAGHPDARARGRLRAPGDRERAVAETANEQCIRVLPEIYRRWRGAFANSDLFVAPDLDAYATHVVECCFPPARRASRLAADPS